MEVVVDLADGCVTLHGRDEFDRFAVRVLHGEPGGASANGALGRVAEALHRDHIGRLDPSGDALIVQDALRLLATRPDDAADATGWDGRFRAMVDAAAARGWTAPDGSIRAHLEWGE